MPCEYDYNIVKNITVELADEYCKINVEHLHNVLLSLPAGLYLELYALMSDIILNGGKGAEKNA